MSYPHPFSENWERMVNFSLGALLTKNFTAFICGRQLVGVYRRKRHIMFQEGSIQVVSRDPLLVRVLFSVVLDGASSSESQCPVPINTDTKRDEKEIGPGVFESRPGLPPPRHSFCSRNSTWRPPSSLTVFPSVFLDIKFYVVYFVRVRSGTWKFCFVWKCRNYPLSM